MLLTIQRLYALAIYLLRELIRAISFDRFFEYKARITITVAEASLVGAAALTISVATGHPMALLRPTGMFVGLSGVLSLAFYYANEEVERRLLPRFEQDFARLTTANRIIGTIIVLLVIALTFAGRLRRRLSRRDSSGNRPQISKAVELGQLLFGFRCEDDAVRLHVFARVFLFICSVASRARTCLTLTARDGSALRAS